MPLKHLFSAAKNQWLRTFSADPDELDIRKIQVIDPNPFDLNHLSIGAKRAVPDVEMSSTGELPRHGEANISSHVRHSLLANFDPIIVAVHSDRPTG